METVPRIGLWVNPNCQQSLADPDDKTRPHERPAILEDEQGPWPVAPPYHVSQQCRDWAQGLISMTNVHQHTLVKGYVYEALILTCTDCGFARLSTWTKMHKIAAGGDL